MSKDNQPLLLDLNLAQLHDVCEQLKQPAFRARQLYQWLHVHSVLNPAQMTNLPQVLRDELTQSFDSTPFRLRTAAKSSDSSYKYLLRTRLGNPVEAVLMPGFSYGTALCASCHSGCPLACSFCQTGRLGLREHLTGGQVLGQLYMAEEHSGVPVDRLVLMGMGEPLLNLDAVSHAVNVLTNDTGRAWSPRRITLSTIGLYNPMLEVARTFPRINLALSLHFTTADKRREHMPKAEPDPGRLMEALSYYRLVNGGKISIEYVLIAGLNDRERDARRLTRFARLEGVEDSPLLAEAKHHSQAARLQPLPLHVNLIAYNPIPAAPEHKPSSAGQTDAFARVLAEAGVPVTVRKSRGADIAAACGQLGSMSTE